MRRLPRVAGLAFVLAISLSGPAAPQPADPPSEPPPQEVLDPFVLHPTGEGAIAYDDLSPAEQEAVMNAAERAELDSGDAVHQAYSVATGEAVTRTDAEIAARELGLEGFDGEGVVP